MGILGCARRNVDKPRIADEVGVLRHVLERAKFAVAPEGVRPPEGNFLDGPVLGIRRPSVTVTDRRSAVGVESPIPPNVNALIGLCLGIVSCLTPSVVTMCLP